MQYDAATLIQSSGQWTSKPSDGDNRFPSIYNGGYFMVIDGQVGIHSGVISEGTIVRGIGVEGWDGTSSSKFQIMYGLTTSDTDRSGLLWIENESVAFIESEDWVSYVSLSDDLASKDERAGSYSVTCSEGTCRSNR